VVVDVIDPAVEEAVMPEDFFQILTAQQIEDLLAYLMSMKAISPTSDSPSG
jgi:cytochrome c1